MTINLLPAKQTSKATIIHWIMTHKDISPMKLIFFSMCKAALHYSPCGVLAQEVSRQAKCNCQHSLYSGPRTPFIIFFPP